MISSGKVVNQLRGLPICLDLLNQKLTKLKLGKRNELIAWDREDEIGILGRSFNRMIGQIQNHTSNLEKMVESTEKLYMQELSGQ